MDVIHVKNWQKFQHYKHRHPPWIKLHRSTLDDVEFSRLQDDSKLHLIMLWLLASQLDNQIPADEAWLTNKLMLKKQVRLKPLIDSGFLINDSKALAPCLQDACSESEIRVQSSEEDKIARTDKPSKPAPRIKIADTAWIESLRPDCVKQGIDLNNEIIKAQRWLLTRPKRKFTQKFFIGWLNNTDKTIGGFGNGSNKTDHRMEKANREFTETVHAPDFN